MLSETSLAFAYLTILTSIQKWEQIFIIYFLFLSKLLTSGDPKLVLHMYILENAARMIFLLFVCRQKPMPVYPFMFDSSLVEMTTSGVIQNELVVNDLTLEKLQHK